jgi:hypothetical protein
VSENANEITVENSVLIFIDHQPWVAFSVKSIDAVCSIYFKLEARDRSSAVGHARELRLL